MLNYFRILPGWKRMIAKSIIKQRTITERAPYNLPRSTEILSRNVFRNFLERLFQIRHYVLSLSKRPTKANPTVTSTTIMLSDLGSRSYGSKRSHERALGISPHDCLLSISWLFAAIVHIRVNGISLSLKSALYM